ncbi:MAG TPA: dicarboxylate/amino acid:cation symporter [Thermoguttaceae bacterium]|nr:dicarboxylate/amino acid:cation symporter [Thermoguttaceae bacterium]
MSMDERLPGVDEAEPSPSSSGASARLAWYIAAAVVAALAFALVLPHLAALVGLSDEALGGLLATIELGGTLFLRLLKMIVVPLVMFSVASGVLGVGDVRRLGRPGAYILLYFPTTTVLAAVVGLALVNLIQPGSGAISAAASQAVGNASTPEAAEAVLPGAGGAPQGPMTLGDAIRQLALTICTDNLFRAMAEGNLLPLIVFSILFAGVLSTMGRRAEPVSRVITGTSDALLKLVMLLMYVAPVGIFCLVAAQFGQAAVAGKSGETFGGLMAYVLVIAVGLAFHCLVTLPLILFLLTRRHPYRFLLQMSEALLTAFSTASSSATLPVTMECAERRARVSRRSVEFVLPLGSTVNMDGTALYQSVAAVFIAQASGISLGPLEQLTIVGTATLASIGTAGVPQSGLIALLIVLSAVGLSGEGLALVLSVDWLVDRLRTTVNVFGDAVGAAVVEKGFQTD